MLATKERSYYQTVCDHSKRQVRVHFTEGDQFSPPPAFSSLEPCSLQSTMHYSFDMAQQVHYPSNPLQPGPIYFLTPRKCALFGVCCEALPRQITYLIDEASDTGKGSNTIVSMLHHFLKVHSLGECDVHLHKTTQCSSTSCGVQWSVSTRRSRSPSSLSATRSSHRTGVLV